MCIRNSAIKSTYPTFSSNVNINVILALMQIYSKLLLELRETSSLVFKYTCYVIESATPSLEEMGYQYEDDRNAMIAVPDVKDDIELYEEFYDEFDNRVRIEQSMNMIFFGPPSSFLRLDPESMLHILTYTKNHLIPISRAILAWDVITDGKTAAYLQGREFLAFGTLLNVVPEEDLYYVNFGDPSVLKYFANYYDKLEPRKYGVLAAAYRRYFGELWYENSTYINELGYLLCGFPASDLAQISPSTFRELTQVTLNKAGKCNSNQTKTLFNIAKHRDAYGEPYRWSSHEVSRLGTILTCISSSDISSIRLEAVAAITPEVIHAMHQEKLEYFTKQQIMRMNSKTRRVYLIRMQLKSSYDMSEITRRQHGLTNKPSVILHICLWAIIINL